MKTFCLTPSKVESFKKALKKKKIKISDLINMSSEKRTELFKEYAGDNAKDVNLLFEQKLILKNKLLGIKNWASKVGEVGRYSPKKKAEIEQALIDWKEKQFKRIFSPAEEQAFLSDLVEKKFGTNISREEASNIFSLTEKVKELKKPYDEVNEKWNTTEDRIKYGSAKVVLENYIKLLKEDNLPVKEQFKGRVSEFKQTLEENKSKAVIDVLSDTLKLVNNNTIALVASFDNSFQLRQGLHTLQTHPSVWWNGAKNSFKDFYNVIAKKDGKQIAEDALWSDIYSEPNYINGNYKKAKLIPKFEEQFPTSLPERIPGVGRVFSASETAFTGSAIRMRTKLFNLLSNTAKSNGIKMDDTQVKDLGTMINSLTARGDSKILNSELARVILWAPKMLKANIDVLTAHYGGAGLKTKFARKQAFSNLFKIVGEIIGFAVLINAIKPKTIETDPRSSDFLKLKLGNTRIDALTGGAASIMTLIARLITGKTKSISTGEIKKINSGDYGASTLFDVGVDFTVNKTTPLMRTFVDVLRGTDANFDKTTLKGELENKLPISIQNWLPKNNDYTGWAIIGAFVDLFGVNANTYEPQKKKTTNSSLPKLKSLRNNSLPKLKKLR